MFKIFPKVTSEISSKKKKKVCGFWRRKDRKQRRKWVKSTSNLNPKCP